MRDAARLAIGTFTVIRVPPPSRVDAPVAGRALLLAPLTAVPLALLWALLGMAAAGGLVPHLVAGALALAAAALLSRAMHLDGLADTVDGLSSGHDPERGLEVMRRGDVGPAGAAVLVLALLLQAASLAGLLDSLAGTVLALVALFASRLGPAVACRRGIPAARLDGLGRAVAGSVPPAGLFAVTIVLVAAASPTSLAVGLPWYAGPLVLLVPPVTAAIVARQAVRRLGGITGDVLGAAVELGLAAALVGATVVVAVAGTA